ncbi:YciI family protein [Inhella crocodyli]|uniref:YCII-related domain-containing protein n=1 Tax=Inhella crocodyli TaxID=2499851 RepID=A0A3S2UBJ2_9BURK|nr:hypothetical protein [Inhella crocodyli]RVT83617.1 hypothetical protein EOD73_13630 [Inhella crocodyli]
MKSTHLLVAALLLAVSSVAAAQTASAPTTATRPAQDLRFVVVHAPGPGWDSTKSVFEQPGLQAHIEHYRQWQLQGKLELGGPFMDGATGGMMLPVAGVPEAEVRRFAAEDPAVKAGLLRAEVRPWLIGMRRSPKP